METRLNKNPPLANEALNTSSNLSLLKRQSFSVFLSVYCKKGYRVKRSPQCNVIQESLAFRILRCRFRILCLCIPDSTSADSGFHKWLDSRFQNYILDSGSHYLDSEFQSRGFRILQTKLLGFRIPVYLTWGESDFSSNRCPIDPGLISSTEDTNRRLSSKCSDAKNRRGIRLSTYFIIVSTSVTGSVLHQRGLENPV